MLNPKNLREIAAQMLAVAMHAKETKLGDYLARRASDYLDQAADLERAAAQTSPPDEPGKA